MSKAERVQCNVTNALTVYMSTNNEVRVDKISYVNIFMVSHDAAL